MTMIKHTCELLKGKPHIYIVSKYLVDISVSGVLITANLGYNSSLRTKDNNGNAVLA